MVVGRRRWRRWRWGERASESGCSDWQTQAEELFDGRECFQTVEVQKPMLRAGYLYAQRYSSRALALTNHP